MATAEIRDEEMRQRILIHQKRRGDNWTTVEAPLHLDIDVSGKTILLDCLTMFATNHFFNQENDKDNAYAAAINELEKLFRQDNTTLIIVTNEIGLGGVSPNAIQRAFCDLQGALNQYVATSADEVYLLISGIPLKIK